VKRRRGVQAGGEAGEIGIPITGQAASSVAEPGAGAFPHKRSRREMGEGALRRKPWGGRGEELRVSVPKASYDYREPPNDEEKARLREEYERVKESIVKCSPYSQSAPRRCRKGLRGRATRRWAQMCATPGEPVRVGRRGRRKPSLRRKTMERGRGRRWRELGWRSVNGSGLNRGCVRLGAGGKCRWEVDACTRQYIYAAPTHPLWTAVFGGVKYVLI